MQKILGKHNVTIFYVLFPLCFNFNTNTRMHSSRMRTARSSGRPGGVSTRPPRPGADTPPLKEQAPPGTDPPGAGTPPVNRMTDACENITLRAVIKQQTVSEHESEQERW